MAIIPAARRHVAPPNSTGTHTKDRRVENSAVAAPGKVQKPVLKPGSGALQVHSRAEFEALTRRDNRPGIFGAREMKFVMTGVDTANPTIYFANTTKHPMHYYFATEGLGLKTTVPEFNWDTYNLTGQPVHGRKFLAGSIVAHDQTPGPSGQKGTYALEFWPEDQVRAKHIGMGFNAVERNMPFAKGNIQYHPGADIQEKLFKTDAAELKRLGVRSISTEGLFKNVKYLALNPGEGYGTLRIFGDTSQPPSVRDVLIMQSIPNDLTHVAGIITEIPQTPLQHINLKAQQNKTPNAYIPKVSSDPKVKALIGKLVHYKVGPDGFVIEPATQAQVDQWQDTMRPKKVTQLSRDLSVTKIAKFSDISHADVKAYGAKAANLAEMLKFMPKGSTPDGWSIPFAVYDDFMKQTGLYGEIKTMMADPSFKADPAAREKALANLQKRIKKMPMPESIKAQLTALQKQFPKGQPMRFRSSTNGEDLVGFNGAGLYDSYTHRLDEGHIEKTVKQVWASVWNYRAFEEREWHRIDHFTADMAIAVHPNSEGEKANGVAVLKNIFDPNFTGFYVNVQKGESLVTNPDPKVLPDEMVIAKLADSTRQSTQFIKRSTLNKGKPVLTDKQQATLVRYMELIRDHFKKVYQAENDPQFAMEIEFKVSKNGEVLVKQARPWVDGATSSFAPAA